MEAQTGGFPMITTVTTVTTTAITSIAAASLTMVVILSLITLLIQAEIIGSLQSEWSQRTIRRISVVIPPLLGVFVVTIAVRLYDLFV